MCGIVPKHLQSKYHRRKCGKAIILGKASGDKERPLLITLKEEDKKGKYFRTK